MSETIIELLLAIVHVDLVLWGNIWCFGATSDFRLTLFNVVCHEEKGHLKNKLNILVDYSTIFSQFSLKYTLDSFVKRLFFSCVFTGIYQPVDYVSKQRFEG